MTLLKGHQVGGPVVPFTSEDKYATHLALYGKGGYRTVATEAERNTIPVQRRELHMIVAVESTGLMYELVTWSDAVTIPDINWRIFPVITGSTRIDYDGDITGARDGSNQVFTTSTNFLSGTTKVFLNGVRQQRGVNLDYIEVSANTISLYLAPVAEDKLLIEYSV